MPDRLKRLSEGLGPLIESLERRALETQDVTARVRAALPQPERDHFVSASYREDTLVISMDSAAWTSRVRYLQQPLIEALHAANETRVTKIKVRVGRRG